MCTANLCVAWYPIHFLPYCTPFFLEVYLGLPWSLQNGVGQSYHAGAAWYGKKFFGFLSLQVTDQRLQSVFYCGYSEVAVLLSHVQLFGTPWTVARQAPHPWEFFRQEYCSGLPCPPPGNLPNPEMELRSPTLQEDSLSSQPPGKPQNIAMGSLPLLQGIFLTQEINRGHLHCRQILY